MTTKPLGRPPGDNPRKHGLLLRLTAAEYAALAALAEQERRPAGQLARMLIVDSPRMTREMRDREMRRAR